MNYEERVLVLTGYKARAEKAEAELARHKAALARAMEFIGGPHAEHWLAEIDRIARGEVIMKDGDTPGML